MNSRHKDKKAGIILSGNGITKARESDDR